MSDKVQDNPEPHLEGGTACSCKKVLMTPEFMNQFASRTLEGYRAYWNWGLPDGDGHYTPSVWVDEADDIKQVLDKQD